MKLLWHGDWIEAPRYADADGGRVIEVEASLAIAPVRVAGGRVIENPRRKVVTFLRTDGPRATARKARSKRSEDGYVGDYAMTLVLGQDAEQGRVVALAPRMPSSAGYLLAHERLCAPVGERFDNAEFARAGALLAARLELQALGNQTYLYSGAEPPEQLVIALHDALEGRDDGAASSILPLRPPPDAAGTETLIAVSSPKTAADGVPLAVLGAGDYVRIEVGPALKRARLRRCVICDREPQVAALAAATLGFEQAGTDAHEAIEALPGPGIVVVATNHDSHTELAVAALEAGHRVFLEKPTVVTDEDQQRLLGAARAHPGKLEIGFNRRYNPLVRRAVAMLAHVDAPRTITATIREVSIEPHHWYLWPNQGTRVAGNLCHWIDLALALVGDCGRPVAVNVSGRVDEKAGGADAERAFTLEFDDGSVATLIATSRGDGIRGVQERIDIRAGGLSLHLDDLWRLEVLRAGKIRRHRTLWRDKGHQTMYQEALGRFARGEDAVYPLRDLELVGATQLAATELVTSGVDGGRTKIRFTPPATSRPRARTA